MGETVKLLLPGEVIKLSLLKSSKGEITPVFCCRNACMFKPSRLCRLAICRRVIIIVALWIVFLVGANEVRRAAQGESAVYESLKRLVVYSLARQDER